MVTMPMDDFHDAYGVMAGMGGYVFRDKDGNLDPSDIGLNNKSAIKGLGTSKNGIKRI